MICETENGSSLTFAGTQNSNMSDGGAMNNNKDVFPVFVNPTAVFSPPSQTLPLKYAWLEQVHVVCFCVQIIMFRLVVNRSEIVEYSDAYFSESHIVP